MAHDEQEPDRAVIRRDLNRMLLLASSRTIIFAPFSVEIGLTVPKWAMFQS